MGFTQILQPCFTSDFYIFKLFKLHLQWSWLKVEKNYDENEKLG